MDDRDPYLDEQINQVPLPAGFEERMRRVAQTTANQVEKIAETRIWNHRRIERELNQVDVPEGLVERICAQVEADSLTESRSTETMPAGHDPRSLWQRVTHSAWLSTPSRQWSARQWSAAAAAGLLIAASLLTWFSVRRTDDTHLQASPESTSSDIDPLSVAAVPNVPDIVTQHQQTSTDELPVVVEEAFQYQPPLQPRIATTNESPVAYDWTRELIAEIARQRHSFERSGTVLGAPTRTDDDLPELELPAMTLRPGLETPLSRAFNRQFLLRHHTHPLVIPAMDAELQSHQVPLHLGVVSFDLMKQRLRQGRLPAGEDIRVEDFLAAVRFGFTCPQLRPVDLQIHGGPSVFRIRHSRQLRSRMPADPRRAQLLQFAVKAGAVSRRLYPATHLVLLVDASASMAWDERFDKIRRAVDRVGLQLNQRDQVSLVVFNDQVTRVVHGVGKDQFHQIQDALQEIEPAGHNDFANALQHALSDGQIGATQADVVPHWVIITDGPFRCDTETSDQLMAMVDRRAQRGSKLSVFELTDTADEDSLMVDLATTGFGRVAHARDVRQLETFLLESLTGSQPQVAKDVSLEVSFRPDRVGAYRLIGHEPTAGSLLVEPHRDADLIGHDEASALYEIWLLDHAWGEIATATLRWTDPVSGLPQQLEQSITTNQLALTASEMAPSLQAAAVVAETAEYLRHSPYCGSSLRGLQEVLAVAEQLPQHVTGQPSFAQFLEWVRRAERVRAGRKP